MLTDITFMCDPNVGWDSIRVLSGSNPLEARHIHFSLTTFKDNRGDGGIDEGGEITAFVSYVPKEVDMSQYRDNPLDAPTKKSGIFPGSIDFHVQGKPRLKIENLEPEFGSELGFPATRVWMDGLEITEFISKIDIDIDAIKGTIRGWFKYVDKEQTRKSVGIPVQQTVYLF